jgi:YHS domain-containing protein
MLRNLVRLLIGIVIVALVRYVMVMISQAFTQMSGGGQAKNDSPQTKQSQSGGELKKDPVCGTFVATASSVKSTVNGEVIHFCSTTCREKYLVVS